MLAGTMVGAWHSVHVVIGSTQTVRVVPQHEYMAYRVPLIETHSLEGADFVWHVEQMSDGLRKAHRLALHDVHTRNAS